MRKLAIIVMICFVPLFWSGWAFAEADCPQAAAEVISLQGAAEFDPKANGAWHTAQLNEKLCEGGQLWVQPNSRVSLALPGNDVLRLNENTVLTLKAINLNKASILDIVKGFIHFIARKPKEVKIESGIANAAPLGTEFAFSVDENRATLWVYEGGVKFYNQQGSINLTSGQAAEATLGKAPQLRIDIKPQDAVNWALYYPALLPTSVGVKAADPAISAAIGDYHKGRIDLALQRLDNLKATSAVSIAQQTPYFHKIRGAMRLIVGQVGLAQQDIKAVQSNNPNDADALALQSVIALTQNRKDEAFSLAKQALTANPQSAMAYTALSYAEQGRFNLDKALAAAESAVNNAPNDAMALARKAELELTQGLLSDSKYTLQQAISQNANLERPQTIKGYTHLQSMDTDEAMQAFNKAIALDSASPLARLGLGLAKIRDGDLEEGRKELEIAAVLDPNNSLIRSYLGKAYYEENRSERAEEQFKLAKERDPKDPTPYFYDAIRKQTINRPVEALQDMQKAIDLNDNRQVYRSNLLLDGDKAIRSASLGRIYKELGFDDVARWQATTSLSINPSNYSAHRLLADSYLYRPRQELARASEVLQSQLLQPLNYYPIQPQLAYTDLNIPKSGGFADAAFNEYTRLFEGDHNRFTATGLYGSNDTKADETAISGIHNQFAYSLGQLHYQTNGFRSNADLKHDLYNVFAQYAFSPDLSVQAEYRHRETEHGDIKMQGNSNFFDDSYRRKLDQDSYRIGAKFSPTKQSNLLVSFIYADRLEVINQAFQIGNGLPLLEIKGTDSTEAYQLESQYLFQGKDINLQLGGGTYLSVSKFELFPLIPSEKSQNDQSFGYMYSNLKLLKDVTASLGLSYDNFDTNIAGGVLNISQFSPKLGLQWRINDDFVFRAAGFQTVKPPIFVNQTLQPIQIAGFNQLFDDITGTRTTQYGIGLDSKPSDNVFAGVEVYKRDLSVPVNSINPLITKADVVKWKEEQYRFYVNWLPHKNWILNTELRFENFRGNRTVVGDYETAYIPINLRFFDESGFFIDTGGQFVHQKLATTNPGLPQNNYVSNFFLVDAAVGYRFPKRYGLVSLEAKNLLDKNFKYLDRSFQMNEVRATDLIPERLLFARITLNF